MALKKTLFDQQRFNLNYERLLNSGIDIKHPGTEAESKLIANKLFAFYDEKCVKPST